MHKLPPIKWDIIVIDEAHSLGKFAKPSKRAKDVKALIDKHNPLVILMSGTPTPESYSQMYHQVWACPHNPFRHHKNFYKFASEYVKVTQRKINGMMINDYSKGLESIVKAMEPYTINYTQKEAGFESSVDEEVLYVQVSSRTQQIIDKLEKDLVVEGKDEVILADTPVKLMMKVHQLYSGTIKFESGKSMVIDTTKGLVVITGCAHPGIEDIVLKAKQEFKEDIYLVLGGFHLGNASASQVDAIIKEFNRIGVKYVAPCHCTGEDAISKFRDAFGEDFIQVGVGKVIEIEN